MADVSMDYEAVEGVAKGFDATAKALRAVEKVLEMVIMQLRAAAAYTFGMTQVWVRYFEGIKKQVINVYKICEEFARDLRRAITDHRNGDFEGKRYFGEGIS